MRFWYAHTAAEWRMTKFDSRMTKAVLVNGNGHIALRQAARESAGVDRDGKKAGAAGDFGVGSRLFDNIWPVRDFCGPNSRKAVLLEDEDDFVALNLQIE